MADANQVSGILGVLTNAVAGKEGADVAGIVTGPAAAVAQAAVTVNSIGQGIGNIADALRAFGQKAAASMSTAIAGAQGDVGQALVAMSNSGISKGIAANIAQYAPPQLPVVSLTEAAGPSTASAGVSKSAGVATHA